MTGRVRNFSRSFADFLVREGLAVDAVTDATHSDNGDDNGVGECEMRNEATIMERSHHNSVGIERAFTHRLKRVCEDLLANHH